MTSFTIRPLTEHTGSEVIGLDFTGARRALLSTVPLPNVTCW